MDSSLESAGGEIGRVQEQGEHFFLCAFFFEFAVGLAPTWWTVQAF